MRKLDYEFIFTCGIVAFIAALGMVAGIVVLAGAKIYVYSCKHDSQIYENCLGSE